MPNFPASGPDSSGRGFRLHVDDDAPHQGHRRTDALLQTVADRMGLFYAESAIDAAVKGKTDALLWQGVGGKAVWVADQRLLCRGLADFLPGHVRQRHGHGGPGFLCGNGIFRLQVAQHFHAGQGFA